ncbi:MAG: VWA domain-containing protein [Armatimonadota bacterium]|nr:VWA domain-containing protein [Armatimonadota bacterium]MDR7458149.1 VWA domain-containing protein [Armatimonadota bacterium]MDR7495750.1 VWA domain-containing protein [Armatimonadota bacterium]MDR7511045.1 VWA domain-containing protein [Armatimonadota bacterium]
MTWTYPALLWGLAVVAGLGALYVRAHARPPRRGPVAYPLALIAEVAARAGRRRHAAAALFAAALAVVVLGAAGPVVPWPVPTGHPVAVIIDVSRSMDETDILPTRFEASKAAALDFVAGLPRASRVTLVTFGSQVTVVVPLTDDRQRLREAIAHLSLELRTQLGTGLWEGVNVVLGEDVPAPPPSWFSPYQGSPFPGMPGAPGRPGDAPAGPVPQSRPRAIAVLLSDGRASDGVPPLEAAAEARRRGVRVYTVGVGTDTDPAFLRSGYFGVLDEPTLRAIADATGGEYFRADEAGRLRTVYRHLARTIGWERRPTEVAAVFGGVALALLVASVVLRFSVSPLS